MTDTFPQPDIRIGDGAALYLGDCLEVMPGMDACSVDAVVCDPPYGLKFMGKAWDHGVPGVAFWVEALRVAKPGAHLLAFGGTRTHHRLMCAIEDAGWEIRDCLMWVYGSGFPKSLDVSKAIDKAAGAEREVIETITKTHIGGEHSHEAWSRPSHFEADGVTPIRHMDITAPATDAARQWSGFGTALKPAWEPVILARKPLEGTVAANVQTWGTGALNIDGCRVETNNESPSGSGNRDGRGNAYHLKDCVSHNGGNITSSSGRFPANLIHDGSEEVVRGFPQQSGGGYPERRASDKFRHAYGDFKGQRECEVAIGPTSGSAARFFYVAKASRADRDEGLERSTDRVLARSCQAQADAKRGKVVDAEDGAFNKARNRKNDHPTVKPTDLMRYLCRLVTPPGGIILDPFMGSGSTGKAAGLEGFRFVGIDNNPDYLDIAAARIRKAFEAGPLFHKPSTFPSGTPSPIGTRGNLQLSTCTGGA